MALIGFASAIPAALLGSILTIRLAEMGFSTAAIGAFALLHLPQKVKFLWGPIIDNYRCPLFSKLGNRRSWALCSYLCCIASLIPLGWLNPHESLPLFAFCVSIASLFFGAIYLVGIAYEIEFLPSEQYAAGSASVTLGYRLGTIGGGAGALYLAAFASWGIAYTVLALSLLLTLAVLLYLPNPNKQLPSTSELPTAKSSLSHLYKAFFQPFVQFFHYSAWPTVCLAIFFFGIGDDLAHSLIGPFYLELHFSKEEIATATKIFGGGATILGTCAVGLLHRQLGKRPVLFTCGLLHAMAYALCYLLGMEDKNFFLFYAIVALKHISAGVMMTFFIAFLWRSCERRCGASQYAFLWVLFGCKRVFLAAIGGWWVTISGWNPFFLSLSLLSLLSLISLRIIASSPTKKELSLPLEAVQ